MPEGSACTVLDTGVHGASGCVHICKRRQTDTCLFRPATKNLPTARPIQLIPEPSKPYFPTIPFRYVQIPHLHSSKAIQDDIIA